MIINLRSFTLLRWLLCLIGLYCLSATQAMAQGNFLPGYVIVAERDTIFGTVQTRDSSAPITECTIVSGQDSFTFTTNEVLGYGFNQGKYYTSSLDSDYFAEVIIQGAVSLYRVGDVFWLEKGQEKYELVSQARTITTDGGIKRSQEDNKWRGIVRYVTGDCERISMEEITRLRYDEKSLTRITKKYLECTGAGYREVKKELASSQVQAGLMVGGAINSIDYGNLLTAAPIPPDTYSLFHPVFGAFVRFSNAKLDERLAFQLGIDFYATEDTKEEAAYNVFFFLTSLSVPFAVQYFLTLKQPKIYLEGGVAADIFISSELQWYRTSDGQILKQLDMASLSPGFLVGTGLTTSLGGQEVDFFVRTNISPFLTPDEGIQTTSFRTTLGVRISRFLKAKNK